jgi:hypothetical protein
VVDYFYEPVYQNINLSNFPVKLKPLLKPNEVRQEQEYYFKRLKEIKEIVDKHDSFKEEIVSSRIPNDSMVTSSNSYERLEDKGSYNFYDESRAPRFFGL